MSPEFPAREALSAHVDKATHIRGTYRKKIDVNFYVDVDSGLTVMTDVYGNKFLSGFKLNSKQLENVFKRGKL